MLFFFLRIIATNQMLQLSHGLIDASENPFYIKTTQNAL